jgi:hypothetical protein
MATNSEQLALAVQKISELGTTYDQEVGKWQTQRDLMQKTIQDAIAVSPDLVKTIYVAIDGNDTTGVGSQSKPFRTANKGMSVLNGLTGGYSHLVLAAGTYTLDSTVHKFYNQYLKISSSGGAKSSNVRLNLGPQRILMTNSFLEAVDVHIHAENGTPHPSSHVNSPIQMYNSSFQLGTWNGVQPNAVQNAFKYTTNNAPMINVEKGGSFGHSWYAYMENLGGLQVPAIHCRTAILGSASTIMVGFSPISSSIGRFTGVQS